MRLLGVQRLDQLGMQYVSIYLLMNLSTFLSQALELTCAVQINTRLLENQIFDGPSGLEACRAAHLSKL